MKNSWKHILFFSLLFSGAAEAYEYEDAFNRAYSHAMWGTNADGKGHSGEGSTIEKTKIYRFFLEDFIAEHQIKSIVDYGCGDWESTQLVNLEGINYTGVDIVKPVIENNIAKYGSPTVKFVHANGNEIDLPKADLLICKDVLQHLPNSAIHKFITQIPKYKYCLITNDVDALTLSSSNIDTYAGNWRSIDLTRPPFNVKGVKVLTFPAGLTTKQVLLIVNKA